MKTLPADERIDFVAITTPNNGHYPIAKASWRTDPKQSAAAGCIGDIGTHAANLAEYITGSKIADICAAC